MERSIYLLQNSWPGDEIGRLGDKDAAFTWLNRAYDDRSYLLPMYLNTEPRLEIFRKNPRLAELQRKVNLLSPGA